MSDKEETPKSTPEPKAASAPAARKADDIHIVDAMKPAPAPASANKPVRYGNRKKRPGESAPAITSLGSVSAQEEEEIEMDDLPVRATAPQELIDTRSNPSDSRDDYDEDRPRRHDRSRGERRERKPRGRSPEHEARERRPRRERERPAPQTETETDAEATAAEDASQQAPDEDRPERFGTVSAAESRGRHHAQVSEFRPSKDGRTATKPDPKRRARARPSTPKSQKKGILSKIVSLFTGGASKEQERKSEDDSQKRSAQARQDGRGRRGPRSRQNREGGPDGEDGNRRRRRRPRNRKPRRDGEGDPDRARSEGGGGGNRRRRRRPRRPQGDRERQHSPSE